MNNILQALRILSILPVGEDCELKKSDAEGIVSSFSFCGAVISVLAIIALIILRQLKGISPINHGIPPLLEATILVFITTIITGAFHLDGLADCFDALGSRKGREGALEIMKDSHIGTYGVCALILVLMFKIALIASMPNIIRLWVFAASVISGRLAITVSCALGRYARKEGEGLGGFFIGNCSNRSICFGAIVPVIYIILGLWTIGFIRSIVAFSVAGLFAVMLTRFCTRKLGGITGDTLGATSELTEVIVLLALFFSV